MNSKQNSRGECSKCGAKLPVDRCDCYCKQCRRSINARHAAANPRSGREYYARKSRLVAQNRRLRDALAPFAEIGRRYMHDDPHTTGGGALLTVDRTSDFPAHVTKTDFLQAAKTAAGLE